MEDATIYVCAQGARLSRVSERLVARSRESKILIDVPFFRLQEVICLGSIEISNSAIIALNRRGVDVVFLTLGGRFKCRLSNLQPKAVKCRLRQYQLVSDEKFRLGMAKTLVRGKLSNSRVWLMRQNRNRDDILAIQVIGLKNCLDSVDTAQTINELMGIEGSAARFYFEGFRRVLKQDLGFSGRVRRPPTDPVNSMLSFGYTLLFNRVWSAVEQAGLDPMIANFHGVEDRRASLPLDLMEEFRSLIVDSTVVGLVNRVAIVPADFYFDKNKGVRFTEAGLGKFIKGFHERLNERILHPTNGKTYELKEIIVQQALQYKLVVLGESSEYSPVTTR